MLLAAALCYVLPFISSCPTHGLRSRFAVSLVARRMTGYPFPLSSLDGEMLNIEVERLYSDKNLMKRKILRRVLGSQSVGVPPQMPSFDIINKKRTYEWVNR